MLIRILISTYLCIVKHSIFLESEHFIFPFVPEKTKLWTEIKFFFDKSKHFVLIINILERMYQVQLRFYIVINLKQTKMFCFKILFLGSNTYFFGTRQSRCTKRSMYNVRCTIQCSMYQKIGMFFSFWFYKFWNKIKCSVLITFFLANWPIKT